MFMQMLCLVCLEKFLGRRAKIAFSPHYRVPHLTPALLTFIFRERLERGGHWGLPCAGETHRPGHFPSVGVFDHHFGAQNRHASLQGQCQYHQTGTFHLFECIFVCVNWAVILFAF